MQTIKPLEGKGKKAVQLATAFINVYEGAVRSTKTVSTLVDWVKYCRTGPAGELLMVGKTERTLERNIIEPLKKMLGPKRCSYNRGLGILRLCGRTVYVVGANNEAARTKIQGMTLAGAYVDEAGVMPESFFNMLISRLSIEGAQVFITANPEGKNHWLKKNWLDRASLWLHADGRITRHETDADFELHRFTFILDDNPFLSDKFKRQLKASYSGVWYRRFILSEWTNAEGAVYDSFDETQMVVEWSSLPPMRKLWVGVDYGTTNASAATLLGWGWDDRLYAIDEWRLQKVSGGSAYTDAQISESFRNWLARTDHLPYDLAGQTIEWIFVDPAAASFKTQLYYDGVENVANADNDVIAGIKLCASLLSMERMFITNRNTQLLDEIPEYVWDSKASEKGTDKPVKTGDHNLDGWRYSVYSTRAYWADAILGELKES